MNKEEVLAQLAESLSLSADQKLRLFSELASIVEVALHRDGWVSLGAFGNMRLGVQREKDFGEGRTLPERCVIWYRADPKVSKAVGELPLEYARNVMGGSNQRPKRREVDNDWSSQPSH